MSNVGKQRDGSRSMFEGSVQGVANTAAVAATFLLAPLGYDVSVGWIEAFSTQHYGTAWAGLTGFGWAIVVGCTVFFTARASVSTLLMMGGLALAARLFL